MSHHREALRLKPSFAVAHSNVVFCMNHDPDATAPQIFEEHRRWAAQHAAHLMKDVGRRMKHERAAASDPSSPRALPRRLRIAYVSPDLREHPVSRFLEPVLAALNRHAFEVYCYSDVTRPDAVTQRLQNSADQWRSIVSWSDEQVARQVHDDQVDILVDLTGHTANHRLLAFARKPAPIQVTHFGYPNTTGLPTMDYRITDSFADPLHAGQPPAGGPAPVGGTSTGNPPSDAYYTEKLIRLPNMAWCYQPSASPDVSPLPALRSGVVTLGSFNKLAKVNEKVLALWSRILTKLAGAGRRASLLLLTSADPEAQQRIRDLFGRHDIGADRLRLVTGRPRDQYLQFYQEVDMVFDPFPYNGGITTCDALWMGVPVVTLAGDTYVSRQGVSILSNLGMQDWIAKTPDAYQDIVIHWANDLPRLQELRAGLRQRMNSSPVTDGPGFTRHLEEAYRHMWQQWCAEVQS